MYNTVSFRMFCFVLLRVPSEGSSLLSPEMGFYSCVIPLISREVSVYNALVTVRHTLKLHFL